MLIPYRSLPIRKIRDRIDRRHQFRPVRRFSAHMAVREQGACHVKGPNKSVVTTDRSARHHSHPKSRSGTLTSLPIIGIGVFAVVDRQAAASDAACQPFAEALHIGDSFVDPFQPFSGKARPVPAGRNASDGKLAEFLADFVQRQSNALCEDDEGYPTKDMPAETPVARACPYGLYQPSFLIEPQR